MSLIDATFPATGAAVSKAGERANWAAAKSEIELFQAIEVNVKAYGAVGNNSTDDGAAINAAIAAANALTAAGFVTLRFPVANGYRINAAMTALVPNISVIMDAPVVYNAAPIAGFVWTIGDTATLNHTGGNNLVLWFRTSGSANYNTQTFGGVRCYNLINSYVRLKQFIGFNIGFQMNAATGQYCTGNHVTVGKMDAQYAVDLVADGSNAWIIQNSFYGHGQIGHGAPTTLDRAGVRMQSINGALPMHDNKFYALDVELNTSGTNRADVFRTIGQCRFIARDLYLETDNKFLYSDGGGYCVATCIAGAGATDMLIDEPTYSGSLVQYVEQYAGTLETSATGARTLTQNHVNSQQRNSSGTATWTVNKFVGLITVDNVDGGTITLSAGTGVTLSASTIAAGAVARLLGRVNGTKVQVMVP